MANWMDRGAKEVIEGTVVPSTANIDGILLKDTYTAVVTHTFLSDGPAAQEAAGTTTRLDITPISHIDIPGALLDIGNHGYDSSGSPNFVAISGSQTVDAVMCFLGGVADTAASCYFYNDFSPLAGNGSDITITWHADGIAVIT